MTLRLNREFFVRHLFVAVLMFGMGCWFGYDGYVGYPAKTPAELYREIEKSDAPNDEAAQRVYVNAIARQKQFMCLAFLASLLVGGHLFAVSRLKFSFDGEGFTWNGRRYAYGDAQAVDRSRWDKKRILVVTLPEGRVTLDAWHHMGVKELAPHFGVPPDNSVAAPAAEQP